MKKIYTKIDDKYYPTNDDYAVTNKYHFALRVWAVTQAQYPKVPFLVKSINDDEVCLLFFTSNTSICDAIQKSYDKNWSIMCGMDQNDECGNFQSGYNGENE